MAPLGVGSGDVESNDGGSGGHLPYTLSWANSECCAVWSPVVGPSSSRNGSGNGSAPTTGWKRSPLATDRLLARSLVAGLWACLDRFAIPWRVDAGGPPLSPPVRAATRLGSMAGVARWTGERVDPVRILSISPWAVLMLDVVAERRLTPKFGRR